MQLVTRADMRAIEAAADAGGHSYADMMFRAGQAVAEAAEELLDGAPAIVVALIGPGSNGGDGLVASLALADAGHIIRALVWQRDPADGLLAEAAANGAIELLGADENEAMETLAGWLAEADLLLDALLGTGADRPISGDLAEILDLVGDAVDAEPGGPTLLAVDLPTGLDPDTGALDPHAVAADVTVTFGFPKLGQFTMPGAEAVGELQIDDIGIPQELGRLAQCGAAVATADELAELLPPLLPDAHKGSQGTVLAWAGSAATLGAAGLAAEAALRGGCGLVRIALPEGLQLGLVSWIPEATYLILPATTESPASSQAALAALTEGIGAADAVLLGPGIGRGEGQAQLLTAILEAWRRLPRELPPTLVLDADALYHLAERPELARLLPAGTILTPHPGEMAGLCGKTVEQVQAARLDEARALAERLSVVVVLKGALTVVALPDGRATISPIVEPALATAGTGDVLSGLIAGLLAQGLPPEEAALLGVWLQGRAGEIAAESFGPRSVLARDVLDALPDAILELEEGTGELGEWLSEALGEGDDDEDWD